MTERKSNKSWRPATNLVRGGTERSGFGETAEALYLTSGYVYDSAEQAEARFKGDEDGYIYSRYGNPTVSVFEERMRLLEGAEACFATATGMAAVFSALMCQLKTGDKIVSARALFGSCHHVVTKLLPRYGIEPVLVDGTDIEEWRDAIDERTKVVFFETPSNPTLEIIDIPAVAKLAHAVGARVVVDNVFATPILQKPLALGADIAVYSATKHIDGQGRVLGGAILCSDEFLDEDLMPYMRHTGAALSPFNAWVLLKGLETLDLRVERQCRSARTIAEFLDEHPSIRRVIYPGFESHPQHALIKEQMSDFGTMVTFDLGDDKDVAFKFLNALEIVDISNNLGDAKSLVTHPATTTHRTFEPEERLKVGITEGMVRLSVGLEDPADLIDDLRHALSRALTRAA
ncbi:MAG: O-succinylhomoserine sulfhydrylase [Rhodospirillaceae bacterium]|nr:O-succinylhomoserine sulfhydrylase [Rhodospirillaceae bacterium]